MFSMVYKPHKNEEDHYAIKYAEFVVPLVKAVQELSAISEKQQSIIEKQQVEINNLKAAIAKSGLNVGAADNQGAELMQNNPNPFTYDTEIRMFLPNSISNAEIRITSLDGKTLNTIPVYERGNTLVQLEGGILQKGIYIYSLFVDGKMVSSRRMVLTQ